MNLPEISIKKPVFAWMIMAGLILFGSISFNKLGISQLPDVDFPVIGVSLSLNGAAPEVIESQVIDPIEDAIMQIQGIRSITSTSQQSSGNISIEFELDRNIDETMQEVQNRISQIRNLLPLNLLPPTLKKSNPEDQPILWIALTHDGTASLVDTMIYARDFLYNQFSTIPGVGDIALGGYVDPALRVWVDHKKLTKLNFTSDDIIQAIQNEHVDIPAGRLENNKNESNIRIMGEALSPEEFGKIRLNNRLVLNADHRPQFLKDVAQIEEGTVDVRKIARYNGKPAVALGILKQHGSNAVEVAKRVRARLDEISLQIKKPFKVEIRSDKTRFIRQSVDELNFTLLLSAILTSFVCYFFLGSWTSTVNVLMAIPTSIVGTFIVIYFLGFTLNTFTLLGLSLAIGIVVDDAIMMLENIVRHRELGLKKKEAALVGSKEITFAALAATIAVVAIFIPVVFMKGVIGKYFYQYGVTVTAAVILSLLEALTLTPMRCSKYLTLNTEKKRIDFIFEKLEHYYRTVLKILLSHRWKTIFFAMIIFVSSLFIAKTIPSEMMPSQDQSQILLRLKGPVGSALSFTDEKFRIIESYLASLPEVEGAFSIVGGFGADSVHTGNVSITLVDASKRKLSQAEMIKKIRTELRKKLIGVEITVQDMSLRGFATGRGFPIEFVVQGPDWDLLNQYTHQIMDTLEKSELAVDINTDIQPGMSEIQITPNREKLANHGVSLRTVTNALGTLFGGSILNGETRYTKSSRKYSIEVRLLASQREKSEQLKEILVRTNRGELIPLNLLVDFKEKKSLQQISRLDRARAIKVYANPAPGHTQQEVLKELSEMGKTILPANYFLKLSGSSQTFKESFQSLMITLVLGILVSYMVLASQFNSFIHPITVLLALPFSLSGAFVSLAFFHQTINIYSLIGFILLMGIVKKNSILLVDFTNQCRKEKLDVHAAILKACPIRLRPILMTSIATIIGALPQALSLGPGSETTIPMAIAIIGGVTASTFLTLFIVPCAYSLISKLESPEENL